MGKKILVLGGGADQIALIQELQKRGHETILLDYLPNPPAKGYVEKHIEQSTLDLKAVEVAAIEEKVDLICTACTDQALLTVAYVSEKLGLPTYISYNEARNVTNKLYMKKQMSVWDIPTSRFATIHSLGDISQIDWLTYPLVVKPADCNSSKGVCKVYNHKELIDKATDALSLSRTQSAIIEEFKAGIEISADLYVQDGKVVFLSATHSFKIVDDTHFTILGSKYPAIDTATEQSIVTIGQSIAKAFNLANCPLLIQFIYDGEKLWVIEFSARMGGGSKYKLIETLTGIDIMSSYTDLILGLHPSIEPTHKVNYAMMFYVYCKNGIIKEYIGFNQLQECSIIQDYFIYKLPGATISKIENSGDRAAGFLIVGDTEAELQEKMNKVNSEIKILDSNGTDIVMHSFIC